MRLTLKRRGSIDMHQFDTSLYDQTTFYKEFLRDISDCEKQLITESPFITGKRVRMLLPIFEKLRRRGVQIVMNTRDPAEHDEITYRLQAAKAVELFHRLDIVVLYTAKHHRKLAIIDGKVVWEGSLNILSFSDSCEIMRKIVSPVAAQQLIDFIAIGMYLR